MKRYKMDGIKISQVNVFDPQAGDMEMNERFLSEWLESSYCKKKGISLSSVSDVIKNAFYNPPTLNVDKGSENIDRHLDEILQSNMSDDDLASETWVMLSGEDLLLLRKTIDHLKAQKR